MLGAFARKRKHCVCLKAQHKHVHPSHDLYRRSRSNVTHAQHEDTEMFSPYRTTNSGISREDSQSLKQSSLDLHKPLWTI